MKVKLVFDTVRDNNNKDAYNDSEYFDKYGCTSFHSGTCFPAEMKLYPGDDEILQKMLDEGYTPVFYVIKDIPQ